jgi:hemerythrin-like metal-binding protein
MTETRRTQQGQDDERQGGSGELEQEHQVLVGLIGELAQSMERRRPGVAIDLVERIAGTTAAHFANEEVFMRRSSYERLTPHLEEHRSLLLRIDELRGVLRGGEQERVVPMARDLVSSLSSHISGTDRLAAERAAAAHSA